ncbi:MAG: glycosyltransferase family 39 protein, partial [Candidatus Limnocylindrales bacterium]
MTAITREPPNVQVQRLARPWSLVRGRTDEPAWTRPALLGVVALAAVLYVWNLTVSGYANTYYSAAALAGSQSWSAFFFGSIDAANFITVDKPPVAIWVMGIFVRLFGLSSWSVLLPQAIAGVLTVGALSAVVRRSFGAAAGLLAALIMALTPAAVLIFRFNNPDAVLTLLLVASAWALLRSLDRGSFRWVALAATFVGFAFLTKYLQAFLVLPGYALVYGFSADTTLRRRIVGLFVAVGTVLVTSGWWVAIVQLIPASSRPFIGGSTTGSPLDLIFGYDGLGRIFGASGPGGGGIGGGGFGGEVGLFRLFNSQFFGEAAWFIPLAIVGLVVGLWLRRWSLRTDRGLAGYLLWGTWFATHAVIFSYMSGVIHSYYMVAMAPAIAALTGAGLVDLWRLRAGRHWVGGTAVAAAFLGTAWLGWQLLDRTPSFQPGLGAVAFALAGVAGAALVVASLPSLRIRLGRLAIGAAGLGLAAALLAPAAYALATTGTAYGSGDPHPGPGSTLGFAGPAGGLPSGAAAGGGGFAGGPGGFSGPNGE